MNVDSSASRAPGADTTTSVTTADGRRCICDGGAHAIKRHPLIENDRCDVHGPNARVRPPVGYQTCNVTEPGGQVSHLVRQIPGGGTPGPTACGLTRFDSAPGADDADLPGWSMGGGVFGRGVWQRACDACWQAVDVADDERTLPARYEHEAVVRGPFGDIHRVLAPGTITEQPDGRFQVSSDELGHGASFVRTNILRVDGVDVQPDATRLIADADRGSLSGPKERP